ncbi:MarR family winged helix-turn-helix transcriptional regulator [Polynucleobacter asymbioticus]|jgi:DNA-binding MarR family transcriptional regulator|uniref:MarR family transcriptional regulator n=1 Tax=Polynucleobacter asymbioticus TaxID=576611 RepID=A0AAC9IP52_9BURK|nr:MarR family transcriptional regulator [Polynucleobacter asymbioticus]APB97884.1 MarR family transcriptional regulator [Polynucleobacter asymbioticus]APC00169.1 MarR family transcriptional regulator [Polynucleobacter asymbioticus]
MFEQCLYFNTTSLARQLEREWTSAFKPFGLTPSQAFMLRVVLNKASLLQSELASEMNISRPTATRALDGLERLSLIKRVASEKDGREQEIHPTKKAMGMKEAINAASAAVAKRLKKSLGTSHFEDAVDQIRSISSALK